MASGTSQISNIIKDNRITIITGGAGSGKTTLSKKLSLNIGVSFYSTDYSFIGDSNYRKELLKNKSSSIDNYIDAVNQINWWDWDKINSDVVNLTSNKDVEIKAYDRDTASYKDMIIKAKKNLILEGAILNYTMCSMANKIIYKHSNEQDRFMRLLKKDSNRRSFQEIVARWLMTSYSENLFYTLMFNHFKENIIVVDDSYDVIPDFEFKEIETYIPFPV
jgi:uridine kinase